MLGPHCPESGLGLIEAGPTFKSVRLTVHRKCDRVSARADPLSRYLGPHTRASAM